MSKIIGTHDGTFHCDEALALFILRLTPEFKGAEIRRTRDASILAQCDAVVDVGGEYIPEQLRFDHHQRGFSETFSDKTVTKLSSAGLVYKHFGKQVIAGQLGLEESNEKVELLYQKIYRDFIEALDGIDNGIQQYPTEIQPAYVDRTHLASRVGRLNPWWNQPNEDMNVRFFQAMEMAGQEFLDRVRYLGLAWLPARALVENALERRFDVDASGAILCLEHFCPWKEHLFELEKEQGITEASTLRPLYVLYEDEKKCWRVQAIPTSPDSFASRLPLAEDWRGIRDEELSGKSGIPGCIFVHHSGFIGGNQTQEGALAMARQSIEVAQSDENAAKRAKLE
ncbi:metal-dependent protein hydrolase [Syncephalis fuscata]|nr:metal-dependent protein hydrolase [Syncephalis fuscata]